MSKIDELISNKLRDIFENSASDLKNPNSAGYDRQYAEDLLYHTIGPLTDNPTWSNSWTSPSSPPPDFEPMGRAYKWTPEELVYAFAGDPSMLFSGSRDNPKSPSYGNKGGSPLFRTARRVARIYNRNDRSFIEDLYNNGFISLVRMMQPGFDRAMDVTGNQRPVPFISYALRNVKSAMEHGIGGENRTDAAAGFENQLGQRGLKSLLDEINPKKLRDAASVVKGKFQREQSHEKSDDNPFGYFSAPYYQTVMSYADAIESGDEEQIALRRQDITDLIEKIGDYSTKIGGASTGLGQAIDTPDRKTSIGISSIDADTGNDDGSSMAGNLEDNDPEDNADTESIKYVLNIALNHDIGKILANSEKYSAMASEFGAKKGKMGGIMTVNELRYIIRTLGPVASEYPGKGTLRKNLEVPRDGRPPKGSGLGSWWSPGEDPEIEPIPGENSSIWHSIWSRGGYHSMGPTAIADEMTEEVKEFDKLGIPTGREIKTKTKGNKILQEVVSKVAIANTLKAATIKLRIIADVHKDDVKESVLKSHPIFENLDPIDRYIISETATKLANKINKMVVREYFSGITNVSMPRKKVDNIEDKMLPVDSISDEYEAI